MVTPLAVSAPYWTKLFRASVVINTNGRLRVRLQQAASSDLDTAGALAIFAVDFSRHTMSLEQVSLEGLVVVGPRMVS